MVIRATKVAKPCPVALRGDGALLVLGEQGVVRVGRAPGHYFANRFAAV
jgi:hypothetical protein